MPENEPGSLYRRRSDGRWLAVWYDELGRPRTVSAKTPGEAEKRRDAKLRGQVAGRPTVAGWLTWWVDTYLPERVDEGHLSPHTLHSYRAHVTRYLIPQLGRVKLRSLSPRQVQTFLRWMRTEAGVDGGGLSKRTTQHAHATLRAALTVAVTYGEIPVNIAARVQAPTPGRTPHTVLDADQARRFVRHCQEGAQDGPLWIVTLGLGLRIQETCALALDAVDLDAGTVLLHRAVEWVNGRQPRIKATKTGDETLLEAPRFVVEALRRQVVAVDLARTVAGNGWADPEGLSLMFPRGDGSVKRYNTLNRRLKKVCVAAGVPVVTPHELRHACGSLLLDAGVPMANVQQLLRHRNIALTTDTYGHLSRTVARGHADRLDDLLG